MKQRSIITCLLIVFSLFISACNKAAEAPGTVLVSGNGTVMVRPDMVQMTLSLGITAATTKEAREETSALVRRALDILQDSSVEEKNISTASLTFNPEYEYLDGRRMLIGQRAEQRITFSVEGTGESGDNSAAGKVYGIIDRLTGINGIELDGTQFSVKDNALHYQRSRELAFQKARDKAAEYAALSGLKLGTVLSISEDDGGSGPFFVNRALNQTVSRGDSASSEGLALLPAGELEISSRVIVVFRLEKE